MGKYKYSVIATMKDWNKKNLSGSVESKSFFSGALAKIEDKVRALGEVREYELSYTDFGKKKKRVVFLSELSATEIEDIEEWIAEIEIDESELESASWDCNIYGVEDHLAVGGWVYDEDECYIEKAKLALEFVEVDGAWEHFSWCLDKDGDPDEEKNEKVLDVIRAEIEGKYVEPLERKDC